MKKLLLLITSMLSIPVAAVTHSADDNEFIAQLEDEYKPLSMAGVKRLFPKEIGYHGKSNLEVDAEYDDIIESLNTKKTFRHENGSKIGKLIKETNCSERKKEELWYSFLHAAMQSTTGIGGLFSINSPEAVYKTAWKLKLHPLVVLGLIAGGGLVGAGGGYVHFKDSKAAGIIGAAGAGMGAVISLRIFVQFKLTRMNAQKQLDISISNMTRTMIEFHKDLPKNVYQDLMSFLKEVDETEDKQERHELFLNFYHHVKSFSQLEWK